jgi:flagellar assembly protein FliH
MSDPKLAAAQAAIHRWSLPEMEGPVLGGRIREDRAGAEAISAALAASEARGYQAGMARAQAEMQSRMEALDAGVKQLSSILELLARPLEQLDSEVEKELLQLALAVGKQLARRELRVDPAQIIGIIRESLAQLPAAARDIRVHLHPEDATTVRERLTVTNNERAWSMIEDPTLSRGGCIIRTEVSQVDVRLESRISAVIASALGEERTTERQAGDPAQSAE